MSDLRKAAQDVVNAYDSDEVTLLSQIARDDKAIEALRTALAETPEAVTRIQELEQLVKAQQKAFDIESNRITFAEHKSFHKMLIRDAIKKMNDCKGRPYSAWDMWLIDAKCMLERVLREWPAPQEVTLTPQSYMPSVDALIAEAVAKEREACAHVCDGMVLYTGFDCAEAIRARGGA